MHRYILEGPHIHKLGISVICDHLACANSLILRNPLGHQILPRIAEHIAFRKISSVENLKKRLSILAAYSVPAPVEEFVNIFSVNSRNNRNVFGGFHPPLYLKRAYARGNQLAEIVNLAHIFGAEWMRRGSLNQFVAAADKLIASIWKSAWLGALTPVAASSTIVPAELTLSRVANAHRPVHENLNVA